MTDAAELVNRLRDVAVRIAPLGQVSGETRWEAAELMRTAATALAAQQDGDDQRGMIWWNSLSDEGRKKWVQPSGRAVDAWEAFKLAQQDGAREALASAWMHGHCAARGFAFSEVDIPGCKGSWLWHRALEAADALRRDEQEQK